MTDAILRPEIYREPMSQEKFGIVEKPLTPFERLYNQDWVRKLFVLIVIAACWEAYARWLDNELLVPTFSATVLALFDLDPTLVPHVPVLSVDAHHMGWPLMKVLQARASGSND